ncbi:exodeoxyribonuclease V subunit alpha [Castellaniella sp.]|uniref:exodeoxyribonuclease V subunit alpha n=1 Tax=Castellaniella sp. TaxID=1955812 RepID=UPI002AFDE1F9|nr:exodeoxyribonuclease V subunit alpha [Castellaniella sp.]
MNDLAESQGLAAAFGQFLARQAPTAPALAVKLADLCSAHLAQGHICLDLKHAAIPLPCAVPDALAALAQADFVGDGNGAQPLVLRGTTLYLARYWRASIRIRQAIEQRLMSPTDALAQPDLARQWLDRMFPPTDDAALDWQKLACAVALRQRFSIITGGPGTGKTTTVVRLLTVLQGLAQARGLDQGLRIRLAAPTGKAAARLNESIAGRLQSLEQPGDARLQAALTCVPARVTTLHSLLGSRPGTRRLTYHAGHKLDLDVLVIDEASMIDIEMMDAVLAALPAAAQLILLGDKDQLASVEAGAVLGELCARAEAGHYTPDTCQQLMALCGQDLLAAAEQPELSGVATQLVRWPDAAGGLLDQAVVMLRRSMRFGQDSGIGRFAVAVNQGLVGQVQDLLSAGLPDLRGLHREADFLDQSGILADDGYPAVFEYLRAKRPAEHAERAAWDEWARALLQVQGRFQVLCALRQGDYGVEGLNRLIESRLRTVGLVPDLPRVWYPGQPVLVRRNLPGLGLANGDMGLVLPVPAPGHPAGRLRAVFAGSRPGTVRWVSPARLGAVETAYALTVHKSQGSEFDRVVLVLPDTPGPLMTRELLYTGATRARQALTLVLPPTPGIIEHAVRHPIRRARGIWTDD